MDKSINDVHHFVSFAAKHLKLSKLPHIRFVGHEEDNKQAFGHSKGSEIVVRTTDRHPIDVMRTLAHELTHFKQGNTKASEQSKEDQANAIAGRIMRAYDTKYPKAFKDNPIHAVNEDGGVISSTPTNNAGGGAIEGIGVGPKGEPGVYPKKKKLRNIIPLLSRNAPNI
jgi:hypothetical protein